MSKISKQLNLKGHMAGWPESKGGCPAFVHSAVDIEGHVGKVHSSTPSFAIYFHTRKLQLAHVRRMEDITWLTSLV